MKYSEGRPGRVIVAKFDDGEEMVGGLRNLVTEAGIDAGVIFFLGALRNGETVAGPRDGSLPPIPAWLSFGSVHEVVGIGTVFPSARGPAIHLHGALGRGEEALTVCLRRMAVVYLILEVVILEILDTPSVRVPGEKSDLLLLEP